MCVYLSVRLVVGTVCKPIVHVCVRVCMSVRVACVGADGMLAALQGPVMMHMVGTVGFCGNLKRAIIALCGRL